MISALSCALGDCDKCVVKKAKSALELGPFSPCKTTGPDKSIPPWRIPITVHLNRPCDLHSDRNCRDDKVAYWPMCRNHWPVAGTGERGDDKTHAAKSPPPSGEVCDPPCLR